MINSFIHFNSNRSDFAFTAHLRFVLDLPRSYVQFSF